MPSLSVNRIKSINKAGLYADGHNLYLKVKSKQSKSWVFRYMFNQRRHDMGLGSAELLPLADARIIASEQRRLLHNKIDPIEYRKELSDKQREQALQKKREGITFESCANEYIQSKCKEWSNSKNKQQWENTLNKYAYPYIGKHRLNDIDQDTLVECLKPIWNKKTETATRVRQRIESIINFGKTKGYCSGDNPASWRGGLEFLLPNPAKIKKVKHHPALDYELLPQFMAELRANPNLSARALELLILTAARTNEIRCSTWSELDLSKQMWIIPKERMKAKNEHRVALSGDAVALIERLHKLDNYLFSGSKKGKPISNGAMSQLLKRMGYTNITVHGFRSTFRDWVAEQTNFSGRLAETAMAHKLQNETEAAYQRRDMIQKRFEMMNAWADYCDSHRQKVIKITCNE